MKLKKYIKILIELIIILSIIIAAKSVSKINIKYKILAKAQNEEELASSRELIQTNKEWQNEDFWEWHTRDTVSDIAYNGKHIEIGEDIVFYGYGVTSYKDFLYKNYSYAGKKSFAFTVDETLANYHTLDGAGFIFNSKKEDEKLSGYILLYREKDICIYRLDDVDINTFETNPNSTVATYGTLIKSVTKSADKLHNLIINTTPTNINVIDNEVEILNMDLDYTKHVGESFGLISSYLQHNCSILSTISFKYFELDIQDYKIPVLKTDEDGGALQGAKFKVTDEEGNVVREGISNEEGIYYIEGLPQGIYSIQETEAPKTYKLNNTVYKFKVTEDGKAVALNNDKEINLIFKNEPLRIDIYNKIKDTEIGIQGSKIALYNKNGKPIVGEDGKQIIITTDKDGKGSFIGIEAGNYIYKQIETPGKYVNNSTEYECSIDEYGNVKFEENNGIIYNEEIEESEDIINNGNVINKEDEKLPSFLPQTGQEKVNVIIFVFIIIAIYSAIKLNKYKE